MKKVLVVEDNASLKDAIKFKLAKGDYDFSMVSTAEDALKELKKQIPDVIWLDLLLPGQSGLDFLKVLRSNKKYMNIPVLIVSNSGSEEKQKTAEGLNILGYFIKSNYTLDEIFGKIKEITEK